MARARLLVLLNDDTLVPPGWLPRLVAPLADPAVGLVGAVTNRIGNEAEVPASYGTWGEMVEFAAARAGRHAGKVFDIATVTMFCMAMRATPSRGSARSTRLRGRAARGRRLLLRAQRATGWYARRTHSSTTSERPRSASSCPRAPTTSCWRRTSAASRRSGANPGSRTSAGPTPPTSASRSASGRSSPTRCRRARPCWW